MNDAFRVGGFKCVGNLDGQPEQYLQLHRPSSNPMLQRHPIQKLHDEERVPVLLPDLMDCADIGMVQGGRGLRFPLEAG